MATLPGHGRAHAHDLVRRQDVQHDGLEDRLDVRAGADGRRGARPPSSSSPTSTAAPFQPAIAVGLGLPDAFFAELAADLAGQARPARRRAASRPGSTRLPTRGDVLHHRRHPPAAARRRRHGVLPRRCPSACGVVAIPNEVFYAQHRARPAPGALRVLQAPRRPRRGRRAAGASLAASDRADAARSPPSSTTSRGTTATPTSSTSRRWSPARPASGAGLVLLTETFSTGFVIDDPSSIGEPEGGPSSQFLAEQAARARRVGRRVVPGDRARRAGRRPAPVQHASCSPGPTARMHRYRKIHPFSLRRRGASTSAPARDLVTVDIDGLRVSACSSATTCASPTSSGSSRADTDVYLVPANWPAKRREHWMALLQARAIENQAYVVGVNRVGTAAGSTTPATAASSTRSASCWPPPAERSPCCSPTSPPTTSRARGSTSLSSKTAGSQPPHRCDDRWVAKWG